MPSLSSDARFLGIDLHTLWRDIRHAWAGVNDWPVLSWLTPEPQVVLLHADGGQSFWCGGVVYAQPVGRLKASFTALELPDDYVLRRTLTLPRIASSDLESAIALQARSISPFPVDDLVWGYIARGGAHEGTLVELMLASRRQVSAYAASQAARLGAIADYEVWVRGADGLPAVLRGYGEGARKAYARRFRKAGYALLALSAVLLLAMAITPTLQLRMRALQASASYQALSQRVAPQVQQREAMLKSIEKLSALSELVSDRLEPLRVLDMLTKVLPDDTAVQSFKLQGRKVTLAGITGNASALMQLLGEQPGLRDVKAPSPATRLGTSAKESFVIEFTLDLREFGVVVPASVASTAVLSTAPTASSQTASVAAPVPATSAAPTSNGLAGVAPIAAAGAGGSGGASFGGAAPPVPVGGKTP
ncbi:MULTISPECIES: PilN domain-containing protein [unclassified Acidovorax]|uniref:PilN domain-containing protein n=1 Tax=unclassified Acidovorax TaxID=2684926 RepID=UPI002882DB99|nr:MULTISPECIES: PilN domain-containing protein [unclassified Acidovorax]